MAAWATGIQLGPYVLLAQLGAGGMGEVWKARDTRLNRNVAVKRLKSKHSARFEQEARAIAALNHPNICQIHDIGPDYLVLEYIEGKPLAGPVPAAEAVRVATQIAKALDAAHRKGVTHRDLKPANIMVTSEGAVKLLDFGLAKLSPGGAPSGPGGDETLTMEGTIMGTAAYMAPEQAQGKPLDARSDIFSFGAVLYELLSGRRAFSAENALSTMAAILHKEPAPLDAPPALQQIVKQCLAKSPNERFQSTAELLQALDSALDSPAREGGVPSIAVLPFANLSGDKEQEYFSDGLAEEILNALAHVPGLKVTARTSSFAFRGKEQDISEIASKLHVRTILEGSVRRAGARIRVTAQLINAEDGYHLWSERYDRELTDVFAVQDEIAAAIAEALQVKLASQPGAKRHQPNLPAYEAFLKGRQQYYKYAPDSLARAKDYYEQAIALDPQYPDPHGELAIFYVQLANLGLRPTREVIPLLRSHARKALELNPSDPHAHIALAVAAVHYDYDWKEADAHARMALAAEYVPPEVRPRCAVHVLSPRGRFPGAVRESEKALEQDPLNAAFRVSLAIVLSVAGLYDRALAEARNTLELDEKFWIAHYLIGGIYAVQGMFSEALGPAERAYRLAPWNPGVLGLLAGILARLGERERAAELLDKLRGMASSGGAALGMVRYHLLCSQIDDAADWLEKAIEQREIYAPLYAHAAYAKPLRESPRWPKLARMMNLPAGTL